MENNMKYFEVEAVVSLSPVYSDGTFDIEPEHAQDNILKYICVEYDEIGAEIGTKEYDEKEFYKIGQEHPAGEWQNHNW